MVLVARQYGQYDLEKTATALASMMPWTLVLATACDEDGQIPPGSGDAEEVGDGVEAWCLVLLLGARRATAARIRRRKKRGRSPGVGSARRTRGRAPIAEDDDQ